MEVAIDDLFKDALYTKLYYFVTFALAFITSFRLSLNSEFTINNKNNFPQMLLTIILSIILIYYFGMRTTFGVYISDTVYYDWSWQHINEKTPIFDIDKFLNGQEWLFTGISVLVWRLGGEFEVFMTVVAFIYISSIFLASYHLMKANIWIAFIFFVVSFSFFGAGVNGIRNGVALHLVIYGISLLLRNKKSFIFSLFIFLIAYFLHNTSILPIICVLIALWIIKEPKYAIAFWFLSILISLTTGNYIGSLFVDLGFDERMEEYFFSQENVKTMSQFSSSGFRWDFLIYSSVPVFFVWYLTIKRDFRDRMYNIIAITYILSNSFWIMVIRASFSNRFAYLSWFIYPLVIIYPLLRMNIWTYQKRYIGLILFLYSSFTFTMYLLSANL